jgi:ABC-type branched-subunit amino acid transport system substrate-binding protein
MLSTNAAMLHQSQVGQSAWVNRASKALVLLAFSLLAACASVVPRGGEIKTSTPVVTPDVNNVVARDSDRHRVALLLPVSGPDADVGQSIANATTLALLDTNNRSIRMTTYDTALGVDVAARKAIADGNRLILGPLRGDNVITVADIARPAGVPIISFSNDIGVAGRNVFLLGHLPGQSIDRVVSYAKSMGMSRFGAIVPKTVYGQRASTNMLAAVRNAGATLTSVQESDGTAASIDAATRKLAAAGPIDAVLIADNGRVAIATISSLRTRGLGKAKILGTDLWNTDGTLAGKPMIYGALFASVPDGIYKQYADKYRLRYGKAPLRLSSLGYDSVLLVARVAENWKIGSSFPVARLTDSGGFSGIDGAFRFMANGMSERMLEVQKIQAGQFVTVDPAPRSFAR